MDFRQGNLGNQVQGSDVVRSLPQRQGFSKVPGFCPVSREMYLLFHLRDGVEKEPDAAFGLTAQCVMRLQLKPSQTPEHLLRWLQLAHGAGFIVLQVGMSIPQILPETQNSYDLAKKKRKDNFTATSTAAAPATHVPEGHPRRSVPELPT